MSKAFIKNVHQNTKDSHQTSPGWMLTFVRWENRSPKTISKNEAVVSENDKELTPKVSKPLVVVNDCISITVSSSKSSHTPMMVAVLKAGDINYLTAVAPGDFVFVNILDWDTKILKLKEKAEAGSPINGIHDGFKGVFKVQSVRQVLSTNPQNGARDISFQIEGYAFTELNNSIYFNQYLLPKGSDKSLLYVSNISTLWEQLISNEGAGLPDCQNMISVFIRTFLGEGVPQDFRKAVSKAAASGPVQPKTAEINYNLQFQLPNYVGSLLGIPQAKAAKDLYTYIMGIQQYTNSSGGEYEGFIPNLNEEQKFAGFFYTPIRCQGTGQIKADYWNQVPVWNILQEYLNSPINEMYTCFRVHPDGRRVVPTLVLRQIPFSSPKYEAGPATKFLNVPRWKIDPKMIYDINIGRDESLRVNFVQVFGMMPGTLRPDHALTYQMASDNTYYDEDDIKRSGMRPYVITSNFALSTKGETEKDTFNKSLVWTKLMGDIVIGQHLKLNGSFVCAGIEEPIAVGDNVQVGDNVFHIESVVHVASIASNGEKIFRTNIDASHGVSSRSDSESGKVYSQMQNEKMLLERQEDHNSYKILPGVSDTQTNYPAPFTDTNPAANNRVFQRLPRNNKPKKDGDPV